MPAIPNNRYFIDHPEIQSALDDAALAALARLTLTLPELGSDQESALARVRQTLSTLLTDGISAKLAPLTYGPDAFGDRFDLASLPLARPGTGYAVQLLDTDTLLDQHTATFLPVRSPTLSGLFPDFDAAYMAARSWLEKNAKTTEEYPLAIVPACFDTQLERHVLIYGVLTREP